MLRRRLRRGEKNFRGGRGRFDTLINFHYHNSLTSSLNFTYLSPHILIYQIVWKWYHPLKFKYFVAMVYYPLLSCCIVFLLLFMRDTIYFYHYFVLQAREIHYEVPKCFLPAKNVGRSFQYHPHTHFRQIHILPILA